MTRVQVKPELLRWACQRSRMDEVELAVRFPKLDAWLSRETHPTFKQLEAFAQATHVPFGYLFLPDPPDEPLPIADFRTTTRGTPQPSGELLDTIYLCQQRQAWYSEEMMLAHEPPSPLVAAMKPGETAADAAARARKVLEYDIDARPHVTPDRAFALLAERAEAQGVLVMVSGVVGSNTSRRLDVDELRGFSLADDPLAPVVFVNGADAKAAQVFTLAHELGHLWRGESAVSTEDLRDTTTPGVEAWCNAFAAELLAPEQTLRQHVGQGAPDAKEIARRFGVSEAVIVRRLFDLRMISRQVFDERMAILLARRTRPDGRGGDFYATLFARASKRLTRAVVAGALEGRIPYTRAMNLLGFHKLSVFDEVARRLDLAP
ncbi:MAG: ImmA/IrrE family metallo-endopeptidase [Polyangiaceae bacterium]|nr:ImmA/IrrE family metallo-endopeptidase [Polyangiaceae bacterium]